MTDSEIISHLTAAQPLANKLAAQGMEAPLTAEDHAILAAISAAAQTGAFERETHTDELRRAAGLRPSDLGALLWVLQRQEIAADPKGVLIATLAALGHTQNRPETSLRLSETRPSASENAFMRAAAGYGT